MTKYKVYFTIPGNGPNVPKLIATFDTRKAAIKSCNDDWDCSPLTWSTNDGITSCHAYTIIPIDEPEKILTSAPPTHMYIVTALHDHKSVPETFGQCFFTLEAAKKAAQTDWNDLIDEDDDEYDIELEWFESGTEYNATWMASIEGEIDENVELGKFDGYWIKKLEIA